MAILLLVSHHRRYTRRSEMKAIIATVISIALLMGSLVFLMEKHQSVFAQTISESTATDPGQLSQLPHSHNPQAAYQSGFEHGVIDGNTSSNTTSYIDLPHLT